MDSRPRPKKNSLHSPWGEWRDEPVEMFLLGGLPAAKGETVRNHGDKL